MGTKRKAVVRHAPAAAGPGDIDPAAAMLGPIASYKDIADDQEQYFDKILLEDEPKSKRAKRLEEEDEFLEPSDEEILADSDSSEEEDEDELDQGRMSKARQPNRLGQDSDEEREEGEGDGDGDLGWWGSSKREYYNADKIETEADALEEGAEALKQQQKQLAKMSDTDFIFDENEWLAATEEAPDGDEVVTETLKDIEVTDDMGPDERSRLLESRYPEFNYLVNELLGLEPLLAACRGAADGKPARSVEAVKYVVLGSYVACLMCYVAILTSPARDGNGSRKLMDPAELREHEVMGTLVNCREAWLKVKDLRPAKELHAALSDMSPEEDGAVGETQIRPSKKALATSRAVALVKKESAKEKAKKAKNREIEESLADLSGLLAKTRKPRKSKSTALSRAEQDDNHSDLGDEDALDAHTAATKAAKKKSLRFYTSQIAQKANRREEARRAAGGDDDLPYRERFRDRQARLNAEAERRRSQLGAELGDGSDDEAEDAGGARDGGDEEYYNLILNKTQKKKAQKEEARVTAANSRPNRIEEEMGGEGDKRAVSWQVMKNKGLTPRRKKEVRNPRVKKRMKFAEKTKKLASMKAVWKGGEGQRGYQGELSGIKTGLIKSIKL